MPRFPVDENPVLGTLSELRQFKWAVYYLPTIKIENESGTMGPRAGRPAAPGRAPAGAGSKSAVMVSTRFVFVSRARVLAPDLVCSVCSTAKVVGLLSLMNVIEPLFSALIASIVAGLNK